MDAVPPGDVVGRLDHAPLFRRAAHDDGLADQFRPVPFLDRGIEGWCRPGSFTPAPTPNRTCKFSSIRLSR